MKPNPLAALTIVVFTTATAALVSAAVAYNSPTCYGLAAGFALYTIWIMIATR